MKIRPVGSELLHADGETDGRTDRQKDGRTDRQTEGQIDGMTRKDVTIANSRFSQFCELA